MISQQSGSFSLRALAADLLLTQCTSNTFSFPATLLKNHQKKIPWSDLNSRSQRRVPVPEQKLLKKAPMTQGDTALLLFQGTIWPFVVRTCSDPGRGHLEEGSLVCWLSVGKGLCFWIILFLSVIGSFWVSMTDTEDACRCLADGKTMHEDGWLVVQIQKHTTCQSCHTTGHRFGYCFTSDQFQSQPFECKLLIQAQVPMKDGTAWHDSTRPAKTGHSLRIDWVRLAQLRGLINLDLAENCEKKKHKETR